MPIKVMKLNKGNVNTFNNLKRDKPVVVAYLMKGCHWCDQMKPEWNNMKQNISGDGILAEVTVVNGDKSVIDRMDLDTSHLSQGFPSVCRYTPGKRKGKPFRGDRTSDELRAFSKKVLKNEKVGKKSKKRRRGRSKKRKNRTKNLMNKIRRKYRKTRKKKRKSKSFYKRMRKRLGFN
jgi:hypothetical protein